MVMVGGIYMLDQEQHIPWHKWTWRTCYGAQFTSSNCSVVYKDQEENIGMASQD